ncbi:phenylacetate--CoA ligase family protein [Thalassospira indica]|uniref:Phenylacetate--CoA ligase family protein n=1 Tax=Thalassospira indica TaxID=1891279 RepID=A0ABM6XVJ5_9PROT|nr:AMP-binding protein [Thalassospira indica]AXO13564.1 phenylacetate--CoA ligase family protein [Thalassospira indica]OAZ14551.1 AMP-dependent synthetase [Thalassospira profundimaris]
MMLKTYFDERETRTQESREAGLMAALPRILHHAKSQSAAYGRLLADIDPQTITTREALAKLPVTRKSDLIDAQAKEPPLAGLNATPIPAMARLFQSPGPIYDPQGKGDDWWRMGRAFFAAGFRPGDIVHNCLSYHLTPGGFIFDSGARACGCVVVPAGVGQSEAQVKAISDLKPTGYSGTPSFLKILIEKAEELGADITSIKRALVSGEALPESLRSWFAERDIAMLQCYASADLGLIAYESDAKNGMIVAEDIILEIVRPGTGEPVAEGEVGEVVVTTLNMDYPLIRFATGDLSAIAPGESGCGRTNQLIKGWMGRADQTTKIKGMFVHPQQIGEIVKRHGDIAKARLVVTRENDNDVMTLTCEGIDDSQIDAIAETLASVCKLRGTVLAAEVGSLPNDGKVIDDQRDLT